MSALDWRAILGEQADPPPQNPHNPQNPGPSPISGDCGDCGDCERGGPFSSAAPLGAPGSPASQLEARWRLAWQQAERGFRTAGITPDAGTMRTAAKLVLDLSEGCARLPKARVRELLGGLYAGRTVGQLLESGRVTIRVARS